MTYAPTERILKKQSENILLELDKFCKEPQANFVDYISSLTPKNNCYEFLLGQTKCYFIIQYCTAIGVVEFHTYRLVPSYENFKEVLLPAKISVNTSGDINITNANGVAVPTILNVVGLHYFGAVVTSLTL